MDDNNSEIGYRFDNPELRQLAYTHPSCDAEYGNNQRLEFLGDAVLDLIIAEALYHKLPGQDEGVLDRARASLVNGRSLAKRAKALNLQKAILVGEGQRKHHPEASDAMLEDVLEALIGAVFLDGGIDAARSFVLRIFQEEIEAFEENSDPRNPKSRLQEWTQKQKNGKTPEYELIHSEGPDHEKRYTARVFLAGEPAGEGEGSSIKSAEMAAAEEALAKLIGNA